MGFEHDDHLMDGRRRDSEEGLHVGFGGRAAIQEGVGMDEGKILALFFSEVRHGGIDKATMD
jgi:hypothetical protein